MNRLLVLISDNEVPA